MGSELKQDVLSLVTEIFKERSINTISIEFPDYDTSGGSLGDIIFVDVLGQTEEGEQTFNILIKRSKSDLKILDDINLRVAYINEINLYSKIIPFFRKFAEGRKSPAYENIPKCYGTLIKENVYLILLDNLKTKGFQMRDLQKPHCKVCAELVIEAYAKWQALCMAVKDQEPEVFKVFGKNNEDFQRKRLLKLCTASTEKELDFVMGLYKEKGDNIMIEKIDEFKKNCEENYLKSISIENCKNPVIKHGDCWNNNFLFASEPGISDPKEVIIIDWQNSSLGPPLADVAQYLLYSCSTYVYENIEDILKYYYDILSSKLRDLGSDPDRCFTWQDCNEEFKKCVPPAIFNKPIFVRASLCTKFNTSFDISRTSDSGDCHGLLGDELRDPDEYFKRIDDTFRIFMKKGFI